MNDFNQPHEHDQHGADEGPLTQGHNAGQDEPTLHDPVNSGIDAEPTQQVDTGTAPTRATELDDIFGPDETFHLYSEDRRDEGRGDHGDDDGEPGDQPITDITRSAEVTGPMRVGIRNQRGDVSIVAVEGLTTATATISSGADLSRYAPRFNGNDLVIDVPNLEGQGSSPLFSFSFGSKSFSFGNSSHTVDIEVRVPAGSSAQVEVKKTGDLSLSGRYNEVKLSTGKGDLSLDAATRATVSTASGDISMGTIDNDLRASTGSGDISVTSVSGDVKANTGSGDISISRNGRSAVLSTGSGDISVDQVLGDGKLSSGSGDLSVGTVNGAVKLSSGSGDFTIDRIESGALSGTTASGDINVGVKAGVPVWTDVNTMTGEVHSGLAGAGQPREGEPYIEIKMTTVSGDINLHDA